MLLPFEPGLTRTWAADPEMAALADRHYSRQSPAHGQFCGPGRKLVLRDAGGLVLFAWLWELAGFRLDGQSGYNCAIFRNEGPRLSSEIILEAELLAVKQWGPGRGFTYVDAEKVRSSNPGFCFLAAGWSREGVSSRRGRVLLVKEALGVAPVESR